MTIRRPGRRALLRAVRVGRVVAMGLTIARLAGRPAGGRSAGGRSAGGRSAGDRSGGPLGASEPVSVPGRAGSVSVVIPARDEVDRLGPCLDALRHVLGIDEIVVVDDQSSDGTAALAARAGARVITGAPLPPGWAGKAWALQQGIEAARGRYVVTLDADTRAAPGLVEHLRARLEHGAALVTVAGAFECPSPGVAVLHPAMLTTLVYRYGRPGTASHPDRLLANGQCMAVEREQFLAAGGMGPVRGELVEDVALARHVARTGRRVEFIDGAELLTVRMFESFADTWTGWGRSIALPGVDARARQLADLAVLTAVLAAPVPRLLLRRGDVVDAVAVAVRFGTLVGTRRAYRHPGRAYWCSPLFDPAAVARLALSIARPSRRWRGRTYPA